MSDCTRNAATVKAFIQSNEAKGFDLQQRLKLYDSWAQMYEQDLKTLACRAPYLGADFLNANFSGSREDAQVLDVACGCGLVTKMMADLGFRHFVGVDGSKGMLDLAAETGLYQDLKLAILGTEPLPVQTGVFDVVIIVGALCVSFVPVSVVRELCHAAKPGGLVCMVRGEHTERETDKYKEDLQRELKLMEEAGLWSLVGVKQVDRYMMDVYTERATDPQEEQYISGHVYLYKKSIAASCESASSS